MRLAGAEHVGECLDRSACLTEVAHLLVNAELDVRDIRLIKRFFERRIFHLRSEERRVGKEC